MADETLSPTNLERLLGHLKPDTIAAKLVQAQMKPAASGQNNLQEVIRNRLDELRHQHADADKQD